MKTKTHSNFVKTKPFLIKVLFLQIMNSMKQILACSLAILVVYFSFTSARPVADDYTEETELNDDDIEKILRIPLINAHVR